MAHVEDTRQRDPLAALADRAYRIRRYALRIHRAGDDDLAELLAESAWTTALSNAGIPTPRPVPTLDDPRPIKELV